MVAETYDRDRVVANIAAVVDRARAAGVEVVWVQHSSDEMVPESDGWQIVPELVPGETEGRVHKRFPDAFEETELEQTLSARDVGGLVICGAQTDECIRSTLHGAIVRGYDSTLVADGHTTEDLSDYGAPTPDLVIAHTNLYWDQHRAPGRTAGTVTAAALDFGPHR